MAARFCKQGERYEGIVAFDHVTNSWRIRPMFNGTLRPNPEQFEKPSHWKRPRVIFVCSMSDPFHEKVPKEWFDRLMDVVAKAQQHTFLFLTKRPENIPDGFPWGMSHVWVGVTAENQAMADKRIPTMLDRLRGSNGMKVVTVGTFVSCEPLLGPINLTAWAGELHWIIAGGESGPGFRPMEEEWVRGLRDDAKSFGIPFHYKQNSGVRPEKLPMLDGKVWDERPDFWKDR